MIRIIDGCSTGKTKKLILLAEKHNYPIVCSNPLAMKYKASAYGVRGVDFIDYKTVGIIFAHNTFIFVTLALLGYLRGYLCIGSITKFKATYRIFTAKRQIHLFFI